MMQESFSFKAEKSKSELIQIMESIPNISMDEFFFCENEEFKDSKEDVAT